jgi:hypothetical protein
VLDSLEKQYVRMSGHLTVTALGQPAPEFVDHFKEFHRVVGESKVALERATVTYDGTLPAEVGECGSGSPATTPR